MGRVKLFVNCELYNVENNIKMKGEFNVKIITCCKMNNFRLRIVASLMKSVEVRKLSN